MTRSRAAAILFSAMAAAVAATAAVATAVAVAGSSGGVPEPVAAPSPASPSAAHPHHPDPATGSDAPTGRSGAPGGRIVVHAADSLRQPFTTLAARFEEAYPGTKLDLAFGDSATHALHIIGGAAADVFASADPAATKQVADAGAALSRPTLIARDSLVIAVPPRNSAGVTTVADLARPGVRVALCTEQTLCGQTARRVLGASQVSVRPASVEPDARAALVKVQSGGTDAALVYRTDILAAGADVRAVDFEQATRIADEYSAVTVKAGRNRVGGNAFVAFVGSALARRVLSEAGFAAP